MSDLEFSPTKDLYQSAAITLDNMQEYYQQYKVDWQVDKIVEQITPLENLDIVFKGTIIGAIRLSFDNEACYLRDLQIDKAHQNNGLGAKALIHVCEIANSRRVKVVQLRVFKISPAIHLYLRHQFIKTKQDDRFYYMEKILTAH